MRIRKLQFWSQCDNKAWESNSEFSSYEFWSRNGRNKHKTLFQSLQNQTATNKPWNFERKWDCCQTNCHNWVCKITCTLLPLPTEHNSHIHGTQWWCPRNITLMSTEHNADVHGTAMPMEHNANAHRTQCWCPWNRKATPMEYNGNAHGTQCWCPGNTPAMPTEHNADAQGTHQQFPTAPDSWQLLKKQTLQIQLKSPWSFPQSLSTSPPWTILQNAW